MTSPGRALGVVAVLAVLLAAVWAGAGSERASSPSEGAERLFLASPEGVLEVAPGGSGLYPLAGLADARAVAVAVDRGRARVWAVAGGSLQSVPLSGEAAWSLPLPLSTGAQAVADDRAASGLPVHLVASPADGSVWVARGSRLWSYSEAGQRLHDLQFPASVTALSLDAAEGRLWVAEGASAVALDGVTGQELSRLALAAPASHLVADGSGLWVAAAGRLVRYDTAGARRLDLPLAEPVALAGDGQGGLWVAWPSRVAHLDQRGRPGFVRVVFPSGGPIQALGASASGQRAWVTDGRYLVRLDVSGRRLALLDLGTVREVRSLALAAGASGEPAEAVLPAVADTYLGPGPKNENFGAETWLRLVPSTQSRLLVNFDLEALADEVEVFHLATLELYLEEGSGWSPAGRQVGAHRLLVPWSELGATWSCPEDSDLSNSKADCPEPWDGGTFTAEATDSVLHTDELEGWASWDVTADVASFLSGSEDLYGWLLRRPASPANGRGTYTARESAVGTGPRLVVLYDPNEPPELVLTAPAAGALLATNTPTLVFTYSDNASGVDPDTLEAKVNGGPWDLSCTHSETGATCTPLSALPEGEVALSVTVADRTGNLSAPVTAIFTVDTIPPPAIDGELVEVSPPDETFVTVTGAPGAAEPGSTVTITNSRTGQSVQVPAEADGSFEGTLGGEVGDLLELVSSDIAGNASPAIALVVPAPPVDPNLPPDPSTVAPPLDRTVVTDIFTATEFLYTSDNPIQTGVAPGTIEARRVAVLRGRVLDREGNPLPGASLTVLDHPELGSTLSRTDGVFDLVVNGGGVVTVSYQKEGYLTSQRQVVAPWRDYAWLDDVVLLPFDEAATVITGDSAETQVARGTVQTDADGSRQATLIFPAGLTAELEAADGTVTPLPSLTLRATEYTVGASGPQAMPGPLPPTVAYTYAVELSADEAEATGAVTVRFSEAAFFYVENFLGFPLGEPVPLGYWDRQRAAWIGSPNGRVLEVLGTDPQGRAELDVDGTGSPADATRLAELGFTDGERQRVAQLYEPGQGLWRAPIPHLTPWDCNWPFVPPDDAEYPPDEGPFFSGEGPAWSGDPNDPNAPDNPNNPDDPGAGDDPNAPGSAEDPDDDREPEEDACEQSGSVLECENQVLGEALGLYNAPYRLHYRSDRQRGHGASYSLRLQVSGETVPPSLKEIEIRVTVAGVLALQQRFSPEAGQTVSFRWDGQDAYQRTLQGQIPVTVEKAYFYDRKYAPSPSAFFSSWAQYPDPSRSQDFSVGRTADGGRISLARIYRGTLEQNGKLQLGTWDSSELGLGGWSLDVHHVYDPTAQELVLGDGGRRKAREIGPVVTRYAGTGTPGYSGDGGPARQAKMRTPSGLAVAADGSVYVAERALNVIRRISASGVITTVAGTGESCQPSNCEISDDPDCPLPNASPIPWENHAAPMLPFPEGEDPEPVCGDGGQATQALLNRPEDVALGPDGSLYIADTGGGCIRRVTPAGTIHTVAGRCKSAPQLTSGNSPSLEPWLARAVDDGRLATQVTLSDPFDIEVAADGALFLADAGRGWVAAVGTDGRFAVVAGGGFSTPVDGLAATAARLRGVSGLARAPDGTLYVAEAGLGAHRVWRVGLDGRLERMAGATTPGFLGEGGQGRVAKLAFPGRLAATADGSLYIADVGNGRVRKVSPDGWIYTVLGNGEEDISTWMAPATATPLRALSGLTVAPDAELFVADEDQHVILRSGLALEGFSEEEIVIAAESGGELYVFNPQGRHLRTLHSLTGATLYDFEYTAEGRVSSVSDRNLLRTTVQRDGSGTPTAIRGPYGQELQMLLNPEGYLEKVVNSLGGERALAYLPGGMLRAKLDELGHKTEWFYTHQGRLARELSPDGGSQTFRRYGSETQARYQVVREDGEGVAVSYAAEGWRGAYRERTVSDGARRANRLYTRNSGQRTTRSADGTVTQVQMGPDPRFGMQAAVSAATRTLLPSGLAQVSTTTSEAILSDSNDPLSLVRLSETYAENGRIYSSVYDAATRTFTSTSPEGRTMSLTVDEKMRPIQRTTAGLDPVRFEYLPDGRVWRILQGSGPGQRTLQIEYDSLGRPLEYRVADQAEISFQQDPVNRLTGQTYKDGESVAFDQDASGNLVGLQPPGKENHLFRFSPKRFLSYYLPPGGEPTSYTYTSNGLPSQVLRPGGEMVTYTYGTSKPFELERVETARGQTSLGYDPETGQLTSIRTPEGDQLDLEWDGYVVRRQEWSGQVSGTVEQEVDANALITAQRVNGDFVGLAYDRDSLLVQAGAMSIARDPLNGILRGTQLGSLTTAEAYNPLGEPTSLRASFEDRLLLEVSLVRDDSGRVIEKVETLDGETRSSTFSYDGRGRLSEVRAEGVVVESYSYDANSNRIGFEGPLGSLTAAYDGQDRLLDYGDLSFEYTSAGELLRKSQGEASVSYEYDVFGNLRSVTLPDGTQIEYVIDGQNRRIGKSINGELVRGYLYAGLLSPVAELTPGGEILSRFVFGSRLNVPDYMDRQGQRYRLITDELGSVRLVVDITSGEIVQRLDYDSFGQVRLDSNPGFQPFGFAGGLYDYRTGLVRFGARDYDAAVGRWTARDPILFKGGTTNLYAYVTNDPVNWIDPWGLAPLTQCAKDVLRPYFPDLDLDKIDLKEGLPKIVKKFAPDDTAFFTWGTDIYYAPEELDQTSARGLAALGHELTHTRQVQEGGGRKRQGIRYLLEYRKNRKAGLDAEQGYRYNIYEVEAYDFQDILLDELLEAYPGGFPCACNN